MKTTARASVRKNPKQSTLNMEVDVPVFLMKEGKSHVAYSPVLQLCSHGKTKLQAEKNFREVTELFFEGLVEMGTLDQVLTDLGWTKQRESWQSPVEIKRVITAAFRTPVSA